MVPPCCWQSGAARPPAQCASCLNDRGATKGAVVFVQTLRKVAMHVMCNCNAGDALDALTLV